MNVPDSTDPKRTEDRLTQVLLIGHSHTGALEEGLQRLTPAASGYQVSVMELSGPELASEGIERSTGLIEHIDHQVLLDKLREFAPDILLLCMHGNVHNVFGIYAANAGRDKLPRLKSKVEKQYRGWLGLLVPALPCKFAIVLAPPPFEDVELQIRRLGKSHDEVRDLPGAPAPASQRLDFWNAQCDAVRTAAMEFDVPVIGLPDDVFNASGFLREDCWGEWDLSHGNAAYGQRVMAHVLKTLAELGSNPELAHPYQSLPDYRYWRQAVSDPAAGEVDPVVRAPFKIGAEERVATAGSCFAQHISRYLRDRAFNFIQVEDVESNASGQRASYDFSARYGNIYTSRQLLQLFDRAAGAFVPKEQVWQMASGRYCDPFRPRIEPDGFASPDAVLQSLQRHLKAVHEMFRTLDLFVFTLGLTECWMSREDGAVYPLPPGVAGGTFDADRYRFHNLGVSEVIDDLTQFIDRLRSVNPAARVVLTVSPVPLVATGEDRHVLVATSYSKSVLRVAADEIARAHAHVMYFPSYEIVTGPHVGNGYFAKDRRTVEAAGVQRVMELFDRHIMRHEQADKSGDDEFERAIQRGQEYADAECDEELLRRRNAAPP
jgi:hypothetical protein